VDADPFSSFFSYITDEEMQALAAAYPDDITQVSAYFVAKRLALDCDNTGRVLLSALGLLMH
jgi:hypothetical protein